MPSQRQNIIALYAGSFDPVTHGHLEVIRRAAQIFNELVVGVGQNPEKQQLFTPRERMAMIRPHVARLPNVCVRSYAGLTIDFARRCGARVLLRGIRDVSDLSNELQQANVNLLIGELETVFLMTSDRNVLTSSTYIKQICQLGGNDELIERLVPDNVTRRLALRFKHGRKRRARARG